MSKESPAKEQQRDFVEEATGDLFDAPKNAVLIHACNCLGSWGAGIAKTFKTKYPTAYKAHNEYCQATPIEELLGTCQLIPPQQGDYHEPTSNSRRPSKRRKVGGSAETSIAHAKQQDLKKQWIACLFTSRGYGKATKKRPGMDKPEVILESTRKSLQDLKEQLLILDNKDKDRRANVESKVGPNLMEDRPEELWSCRFNSGLFAVDWADTRTVIEEELRGLGKTVRVVSPIGPSDRDLGT